MLIRALPPESGTKTAMRNAVDEEALAAMPEPEGHGPWSNAELLLAAVVDGVNVLAWQQTQINGGKRSEPPAQIRRPGVVRQRRRPTNDAGLQYLAALRERREASSQ